MTKRVIVLGILIAATAAAACGKSQAPETTAAAAAAEPTVRLSAENVSTAAITELSAGPAISGQLAPAREATVRAQVGGSIVTLTVDKGQSVGAGQIVARISARDLDEAMNSAQAAVRSAETALKVAQSEQARTASLVKGGALAARDLEQANNMVTAAEAQVAAAKARQGSVRQQLDDTNVRAPFAGVVSDRAAHQGDVVSPGSPIVTIIDPSSMRLEALVRADEIGQVRSGATVPFRVRGYPTQVFSGRVDRLSPTADPVTRQVTVFVSLPNTGGRLIAGLFAEGRVNAESRRAIVIPASALDETGATPTVTRIVNGKAERVAVTIGLRQSDTETVEITKGIAAGDVVILGSSKAVTPGTAVNVVKN
ncbi:MAG: efflux RND transporter periplasmic adaptor subunit [Acidobacteria bacterium]|nr:MAG: efflux RND transporter periplasmic adaptor subunit [Acidobacteriota bacterium]